MTNTNGLDRAEVAPVGRRVGAYLLDLAVVVPAILLLEIVLGLVLFGIFGGTSTAALVLNLVVVSVLVHAYVAATMLGGDRSLGQTVGRRALGIHAVRTDGQPLTQLDVATRETLHKYFVPLAVVVALALLGTIAAAILVVAWLLDSLSALFDSRGRTLHDRLVGTRVVTAEAFEARGRNQAEQPPSVPPSEEVAEYDSRVFAALLDGLFSYLIAGACFGVASGVNALGAPFAVPATFSALGISVLVFYSTLLTIRRGARNGQTFGKQLMGIRVVRDDGGRVTLGVSVARELFLTEIPRVVTFELYRLVDSLWPLRERHRRALHDLGASTRVVRARGNPAQTTSRNRPDSIS